MSHIYVKYTNIDRILPLGSLSMHMLRICPTLVLIGF